MTTFARKNLPNVKIRGRIGDWTATIEEWDETLPCVHEHFCRSRWPTYYDPEPDFSYHGFHDWWEMICTKRKVIMTKDEIDPSKPIGPGHFK